MTKIEQILVDASSLTEQERTEIALQLLATVGVPDPHAHLGDEEWTLEIERRAADAIASRTKGIPWDVVEAELKRKYQP